MERHSLIVSLQIANHMPIGGGVVCKLQHLMMIGGPGQKSCSVKWGLMEDKGKIKTWRDELRQTTNV